MNGFRFLRLLYIDFAFVVCRTAILVLIRYSLKPPPPPLLFCTVPDLKCNFNPSGITIISTDTRRQFVPRNPLPSPKNTATTIPSRRRKPSHYSPPVRRATLLSMAHERPTAATTRVQMPFSMCRFYELLARDILIVRVYVHVNNNNSLH